MTVRPPRRRRKPPFSAVRAVVIAAAPLLVALVAAGCGAPARPAKPAAAPAADTDAAKKNTLGGSLRGNKITLLDRDGKIVAEVKSALALVGQTEKNGPRAAALVGGGEAVLHDEKGRPAARVRAADVRADEKTQQVVATGNVEVVSLNEPGAPTIRADRVTWTPKDHKVRGEGNVLVTRGSDFRLPGATFVADMKLKNLKVAAANQPAVVRF